MSTREVELYSKHFEHLKEWNEKISLVSRKSIEQSFAPHYADSIFIADQINQWKSDGDIHDIGTGAGFPGLIAAIRYPNRQFCLYEKMQKKVPYLESAIATLGLRNASLHASFEGTKSKALFIGRAVFPREKFFPFFAERIVAESLLVLTLGGTPKEDETPPKGFILLEAKKYSLPDGAGDRRIELYRFVSRGTK